jgi:hypothetical protein
MESTARQLLRAVDAVVYSADPSASTAAEIDGVGPVEMTRAGAVVQVVVPLDGELPFREALGLTSGQLDEAGATQGLNFQAVGQSDDRVWLQTRTAVLGEMAERVRDRLDPDHSEFDGLF